jgi:hypothetical protein
LVLAFIYDIHLISTAAFAAGLFYQLKSKDFTSPVYDRNGWLWILLMGTTGMFQMSASPNYDGLLVINSVWATALFIKHSLILLLVLVMGIQTFILLPVINRQQWKKSAAKDSVEDKPNYASMRITGLRIQSVLFVLILIATGVARAG